MLNIEILVVGPIETNCYFVYDEEKRLVIIDPGDWSRKIIDLIGERDLRPEAILLTHGHFDHIGAVRDLLTRYPALPVYALDAERAILESTSANISSAFSKEGLTLTDSEITYLGDRDRLRLLDTDWEIISTPGHTAGSACWYLESEGALFAGDTLFAGGCGRTDLETGSTMDIVHSIRGILMLLPDETKVLPGHGPSTTIGTERKQNFICRM